MTDVGNLLRPRPAPRHVFHEPEAGTWSCLYCWAPNRALAEACEAHHPLDPRYVCTRDPGHDGPHVACGPKSHQHPLTTWEDS